MTGVHFLTEQSNKCSIEGNEKHSNGWSHVFYYSATDEQKIVIVILLFVIKLKVIWPNVVRSKWQLFTF